MTMIGPRSGRRGLARPLSAAGPLLPALVVAGQALAGPASDLPWPSGAKDGLACLAQLRGRAIDVGHVHVASADFPTMVANSGKWVLQYDKTVPIALNSFALLPTNNKGQFTQCAAGQFDGYWRQIGANLAQVGPGNAVIVEPGFEAAIGSHIHPWGVDYASQVPAYVQCWQHAAAALRATFPGVKLSWNNAKRFPTAWRVAAMDPGTEDYYGLMYYDNILPKNSQATWDGFVNSTNANGDPRGIGAWLAYARARGKQIGVSEWAVWQTSGQSAAYADDPVYIDDMYRFFGANAASIAFETYQNNSPDEHELCSSNNYPRARGRYGQDWRAG